MKEELFKFVYKFIEYAEANHTGGNDVWQNYDDIVELLEDMAKFAAVEKVFAQTVKERELL